MQLELLRYPASVHQHRGVSLACSLEGRDDEVPLVAVVHARSDQHLLVVSEAPGGIDAPVVEIVDRGGVDLWWEGQGIADEAVFEFSH